MENNSDVGNKNDLDENLNDKAEKIEKEKKELLNKVLSGNLQTSLDRVGFILNNYVGARNSDIELAWIYWKTFESDLFNGSYVTKNELLKLTKMSSLVRSRARIQNEYKLFQADDNVKKYRGVLEDEKKKEAIEEKPTGLPIYSIYIDETGKTQKYLSIGSLWVIDGYSTLNANKKIKEWKEISKIDFEFHFAEVTAHRLNDFKEFFLRFLKLNPTIGFKTIIINKDGIQDTNRAITDLSFHLIDKGIIHENETGRAPLPRYLQVWLDEEEKGTDQLKIENIKERIKSQKIDGLYLGDFLAIDSKSDFYIQAVDLFVSAINRRLHNPDSAGKIKDELADYVLKLLDFDIKQVNLNNNDIDKSAIFNLSYTE